MDAIAEDVKVRFEISAPVHVLSDDLNLNDFDSSNGYWAVAVTGYITSSNAEPTEYRHSIKLVSHKPFHLEYIPYSAWYENNGIGAGGTRLSDDIMKDGVLIGFDALDGRVPGCYKYLSYSTIKVFPVFEQ
jgi:hypothetical protein